MGGGHYVAYAKHETTQGDKWFYFSDSYWKEIATKDVLGHQAYMLFYRRIPNKV